MTPAARSGILYPLMDKPFQSGRCVRWGAGCLLALALSSGAEPRDVDFSIVLPEADHVYLLGTFNGWEVSDDARMSNENGRWRKTLSLEEGTHSYAFKAEGDKISGDGWMVDWKSSREAKRSRGRACSAVVVPDDLEAFHARQQTATETEGGSIEIPLFYERPRDGSFIYRYYGSSYQSLESARPAGDWKLPDLADDKAMFSIVRLGDSEFLAIVARQSTNDAFYNRIYLDRNGNRDLTDDSPLVGKSQSSGREDYFDYSFPWVDLEIDSGGHRLPYCVALRVSGTMPGSNDGDTSYGPFGSRPPNLLVSPNCAYLGEFSLDGTGFRLALFDSTANGTFDDLASRPNGRRFGDRSLYAQGDTFSLTTADRVGRAAGSLLGKFLAIGDRLFSVRVDVPRGRMILEPRAQDVGTLELPTPMRSMTMLSAAGDDALMMVRIGDRVSVPAGSWRLLDYQFAKKDEWGDEWILQARGTEDTPAVTVPSNGTVRLAVGEPLQAVVEIYRPWYLRHAAANGSLRISLGLLGNAERNDHRSPPHLRNQHAAQAGQAQLEPSRGSHLSDHQTRWGADHLRLVRVWMRILLLGHMAWPHQTRNLPGRLQLQAGALPLHECPEGFHGAGGGKRGRSWPKRRRSIRPRTRRSGSGSCSSSEASSPG